MWYMSPVCRERSPHCCLLLLCHSVLVVNLFGNRDVIDFICLLPSVIWALWTHVEIKTKVTHLLDP